MLKYNKTAKLKIIFKFWHWATGRKLGGPFTGIKSLGGKNCDYFLPQAIRELFVDRK